MTGRDVAQWSLPPAVLAPRCGLVDGQPGIVRLPGEISALSRARVVVVYNPCYEPFIR